MSALAPAALLLALLAVLAYFRLAEGFEKGLKKDYDQDATFA